MNEKLDSKAAVLIDDQTELASIRSKVARPLTTEVGVVSEQFGVITPFGSNRPFLEESNRVSLASNRSGIAWIVYLRTKKTAIRWKEELKYPSVLKKDFVIPEYGISVVGDTITTERTTTLDSPKIISNNWFFGKDQPRGKYVVRVHVEGVFLRQFEYDVE